MIKLSTKVRYATRIVVYLAMRDEKDPARKQDIAEAEGISADYVEQILIKLKATGVVQSLRGLKGGFVLGRKPAEISVADVIRAVDGPIEIVPCINDGCGRVSGCPTRTLWAKANNVLVEMFSEAKISGLAEAGRQLRLGKSWTFEI